MGADKPTSDGLAGYVGMKLPGGTTCRFTAGKDLADNQDFYKLEFTKTF